MFQISNNKKRKRGAVDIDCTLDLQCHLVKPVAEQNESIISKCGTLRTESQTLHTNHSSPPEHININVSDQNDSDQEILDINPLTSEKNVHHNSGLCSYEKIIENKIQSFHKKSVPWSSLCVFLLYPNMVQRKCAQCNSSSKFYTCNGVWQDLSV